MKEFEYKELEKATENFSQSRLVGKGSHGCVYKGILDEGKNIIAIKKQSLGLQKIQDNSKLENELADLGLALRMKNDHQDESPSHSSNSVTRPAGTIGYLDPAYTKPSKLSTKNDVFSFGVLLFEIMSSRKVIDVSKSPVSIVDWATKLIKEGQSLEICDKRMHVPWYMESTIKNMLSIATRCVSPKKITRPTIEEIVMEMENVIIEPIKYPLWNILRGLTLLRRKRKRSRKNCCIITTNNVTKTCAQHEKKLLIREILADKVTE
ncbi:hypothetical protein KY284_002957 [Solanum tuberosum]|nr:hypothetical protein KY284_002957 [Solanum tuberosum]